MTYTHTSPLPPLRYDLEGYELAPGIVVLYDDAGYTDKMIRLPVAILEYLTSMDGSRNAETLAGHARQSGLNLPVDDFLELINLLDQEFFLDNERFRHRKGELDREFNNASVRPAAHAGASYPDNPEELRRMLNGFLAADTADYNGTPSPKAVIAPHIDFRVGGRSYGPAYNMLRRSDADTFIIFGVSHRMSYAPFMFCSKDFETPLGTVPTDREFIDRFRAGLPFELTVDETAHRQEHSIEFQAVFLRHIFPDRDIRIIPILTGSLHEYVEAGRGNVAEDERLNILYRRLETTVKELGRNVCYIAGADLCHVGVKFGDEVAARQILKDVEEWDRKVLEHTVHPDADAFIQEIASVGNRYRVCGVAPIYATLRTVHPSSGSLLCYDQWDETERESAVTFASVALF